MNILLNIHYSCVIYEPMSARNASSKVINIQDSILDAAVLRFQHYGIGKTTMAELASDVDMSTANLYRYFKNKEDIAVACSRRCLGDRTARLACVIENQSFSATEKLREFVLEMLRYTYDQISSNPRINELVNIIAEKYPEVVFEKNTDERLLIKNILLEGKESGIFDFEDIEKTTIAVHTAIHIFQLPLAMTIHKFDTLLEMAQLTTDMILTGLNKR